MRNLFQKIIFGRDNRVSGSFALALVGLIALGCTCGDFNLANLGGNNSSSNADNRSANTVVTDTDDDDAVDGVPSDSTVEAMVKETTAEFAEAVDSGDFSQIHANSSSDFQNTYTVDEMAAAFKSYTEKKSVVLPILNRVGSSKAEFTKPPSIRSENGLQVLVTNGKFPTKPYNVRFDYEYVLRDGDWKLLKLVINIP